jgi:hypothetical protein
MFNLESLVDGKVDVKMDMTTIQSAMNMAQFDKQIGHFRIFSTEEVVQTFLEGRRTGRGVVAWHETYYSSNISELLPDNRKMTDLCVDEDIFLI